MSGTTEFMQFVNYMQCCLSDKNTAILTNLYVNFTQYQPPIGCCNFAEKFIFWKQLYDQYNLEQEKITNANLFAAPTPPTDSRLKPSRNQLPDDLTSLCDENDIELFQNFSLKNEVTTTTISPTTTTPSPQPTNCDETQDIAYNTDNESTAIITPLAMENNTGDIIEIVNETTITEQNPLAASSSSEDEEKAPPNYERSPSRGKNIEQLKAIYNKEETVVATATKSKQSKPIPVPRKRKRPAANTEGPGPGRPTKDSALLRDTKSGEADGDDTFAIREVALFLGNGSVRKKAKLLTKHDKDIKCFAIKHYAPLEFIAEEKVKAFGKIKEQRHKLKVLNYMEQNVLANLQEIQNF
ncbi:Hypothetical predicted protein [Paramuricea clavata]|uniref:Uncharacterized protein n=1 Tax=Paramuricea clavata TaxID=317549 RepID=A0A7D9D6H5_PARCT|nr:Hypothetical predicted protein [Paramuricea clavata]